jgi:DNA processing protein
MSGVCTTCARRTWLLAMLGVRLDFKARDLTRLWSVLELADLELIEAIGGRRRADLRAAYAAWEPEPAVRESPQANDGDNAERICRHDPAYPRSLREDPLAPHALSVRGGMGRLAGMLDERVVAIVGTRRASDYGMETARELGRGLAACGLVVASGLAEGIPTAVHAGALEAHGATLTVMAGGVERCSPAGCTSLYRRILERGCSISESRCTQRPRNWWQPARARILALLAELVIVVEAGEQPWEQACAHVAWSRGRHVAAVPGRVSSSASRGTNALLMNGARLVRGPQDALDVLHGMGAHQADRSASPPALEPHLARVLERVGRGEDTMAKLIARDAESDEIALALVELELRGMLLRGDGGRYLPRARERTQAECSPYHPYEIA